MNIAIQYDNQSDFLHSLAVTLMSLGHKTSFWKSNEVGVHYMKDTAKPDIVISTDSISDRDLEVLKNIKRIHCGTNHRGAQLVINIPPILADTITYQLKDYKHIKRDIIFSSNFYDSKNVNYLYLINRTVNESDLQVCCFGNSLLPIPSFIGFCDIASFANECTFSKIVITTSKIEEMSLCNIGINAIHYEDLDYSLIEETNFFNKRSKDIMKKINAEQLTFNHYVPTIINNIQGIF